ncbi:MAG: hypothetical protein ACI4MF_13300 [Candidatus Faecivicinus sp.]
MPPVQVLGYDDRWSPSSQRSIHTDRRSRLPPVSPVVRCCAAFFSISKLRTV